ncbi:MAG TPA: hypothetical protein VGI60_04375 [Chthoniobacterales bacterium]
MRLWIIALFLVAIALYGIGRCSRAALDSDTHFLAHGTSIEGGAIIRGTFRVLCNGSHDIQLKYAKATESATDTLRRKNLTVQVLLSADSGVSIEGRIPPIRRVSSDGRSVYILLLTFNSVRGNTYSYQCKFVRVPPDLPFTKADVVVGVEDAEYGLWQALETVALLLAFPGSIGTVIYSYKSIHTPRNPSSLEET